jgi:hypothetical protein
MPPFAPQMQWEVVAVGQLAPEPTDRAPRPVRANDEKTRQALLAEVYRSRSRAAQLERDGQGGATPKTLLAARLAALRALEDYSAALRLRGWPTPRKLAREMQLLRCLCGIRRPRLHS